MTRSDWIALVACAGTLLALYPAYSHMIRIRKKSGIKSTPKTSTTAAATTNKEDSVEYSAFFKATVLTAMAFVFGVIEIIIFSWIASAFNVKVDANTMPLNWQIGFFSLFLIPGILLFLALLNITSVMKD